MPRDVATILSDSQSLYERKNSDYGESWRLTGQTLALWLQHQGHDEVTIPATPAALNYLGLLTRRLDKMIRAFNGAFLTDDLEVDESVVETQEDQVPYAAMHTALAEEIATADADDIL